MEAKTHECESGKEGTLDIITDEKEETEKNLRQGS